MKYLVSFAATTHMGTSAFGNVYHETDEAMTEAHCKEIENAIDAAHSQSFADVSILAISKIDEG